MKLHKRIAQFFGYELIRKKKNPSTASLLQNLMTLHDIDLVIDVGANAGQFAKEIRQYGYKGEIHSFEPVMTTYNKLLKNSNSDPLWHTNFLALGGEPGEGLINVTESSDLASFLNPNQFGTELFEKIKVSEQQQVSVTTLDMFLQHKVGNYLSRNIFLKMDTQGYDLNVFRGATECLPAISILLSELSFQPIYSGMTRYLEALKEYEAAGFTVAGFYPVTREKDLSVIEMDCVMVKKEKPVDKRPQC